MENSEIIENFFGVYLLYCVNPKYLGRNYIGFTVDPNRRIKQHNKGTDFGGARRTSAKGPWKMVLIVHGFPNDISALRFEWAWQHPKLSRRLKHISRKDSSEKVYDFNLRLLSEMLRIGPWNRLPLTVCWLEEEFSRDFPAERKPPIHMPICYGPVKSKKLKKTEENIEKCSNIDNFCYICKNIIELGKELKCLDNDCSMQSHIICLSKRFLTKGEYIPIDGTCPKCDKNFLWGEIIRKYKGCCIENNIEICNDYDE